MTFQVSANVPGTIQQVLYDFNGDGISDQTATDLNPISYSYSAAGQFFPVVTIVTTAGRFSSTGGWNSTDPNRLRINVQTSPVQQSVINITDPVDLKCDSAGNLYVLSRSTATITEYNSSSTVVKYLSGIGSAPRGLDVDGAGNVYVADTGDNQVLKFNPTTSSFQADSTFGAAGTIGKSDKSSGSGNGEFNAPFDVAVSPDGGTISVSDSGNNRIQQFATTDGTFIGAFGQQGNGDGQFNSPEGLTYDNTGYLYIVDSGNNRIALAQGTFVEEVTGTGGTDLGQFSGPVNIGIGERGVYVADTSNNRIQCFNPPAPHNPFSISPSSTRFAFATGLNQPAAVAAVNNLTEELFYVADTGNNRVILCYLPDGNADAIQAVWNSMTARVAAGDVSDALSYFSTQSVDDYRDLFLAVAINNAISTIGEIGTLTPNYIYNDKAEYNYADSMAGQPITGTVMFVNENGVWKILEF